jgi:hypothetical protein
MNFLLKTSSAIFYLVAFFSLGGPVGAGDQVLSVCEVLSSATRFDGKIIAVRGEQVATGEGAWLKAGSCKPLLAKGRSWPSAIWLDMSQSRAESLGFDLTALSADLARINRLMERLHFDKKRDRAILTYVGRIQIIPGIQSTVTNHETAGSMGFGHLNWAPAEIVVKAVKDLFVERSDRIPGPK